MIKAPSNSTLDIYKRILNLIIPGGKRKNPQQLKGQPPINTTQEYNNKVSIIEITPTTPQYKEEIHLEDEYPTQIEDLPTPIKPTNEIPINRSDLRQEPSPEEYNKRLTETKPNTTQEYEILSTKMKELETKIGELEKVKKTLENSTPEAGVSNRIDYLIQQFDTMNKNFEDLRNRIDNVNGTVKQTASETQGVVKGEGAKTRELLNQYQDNMLGYLMKLGNMMDEMGSDLLVKLDGLGDLETLGDDLKERYNEIELYLKNLPSSMGTPALNKVKEKYEKIGGNVTSIDVKIGGIVGLEHSITYNITNNMLKGDGSVEGDGKEIGIEAVSVPAGCRVKSVKIGNEEIPAGVNIPSEDDANKANAYLQALGGGNYLEGGNEFYQALPLCKEEKGFKIGPQQTLSIEVKVEMDKSKNIKFNPKVWMNGGSAEYTEAVILDAGMTEYKSTGHPNAWKILKTAAKVGGKVVEAIGAVSDIYSVMQPKSFTFGFGSDKLDEYGKLTKEADRLIGEVDGLYNSINLSK